MSLENTAKILQRIRSAWMADDGETRIQGLVEFTGIAWRLASGEVDESLSSESDLMKVYLKESPGASELLDWLSDLSSASNSASSASETTLVIEALCQILLCTKLLNQRSLGTAIIRSFLKSHLKLIYRRLSAAGQGGAPVNETLAALHLLLVMADHGSAAAHELQTTFHFGLKALAKLPALRKKGSSSKVGYESYRKEKDIRSLYVAFIMALIRKGDVTGRQSLLSTEDIIGSLLPGLPNDCLESIKTVLDTLQNCIVDNESLSRNTKLLLLSNKNLERLAGLYSKADIPEGATSSPADLGHAFLLHCTTQPGIGVCFKDEGYYPPSGKKGLKLYNKILVSFIDTLSPSEDSRQQELLLAILKACPELVKPYGSSKMCHLPIDQFSHPSWAQSMELVLKILLLPIPQDFGSRVWHPPPCSHLLDACLPAYLTKTLLTKLLQHSDLTFKQTGCLLLLTSLDKLQSIVSELDRFGNYVYPEHSSAWKASKEALLDQVRRGLPEFQTLLSLFSVFGGTSDSSSSEKVVLKRRLYLIFAAYQSLFPDTVQESRFSPLKILSKDMHRLPLDLQYAILSLVENAPDLKWWQNVDGETAYSGLRSLLDFLVLSSQEEIQDLVRRCLNRVLSATFPFESHSSESAIWLISLSQTSYFDQEAIISFLDFTLKNSQHEMYKIMDCMFPFYAAERQRLVVNTMGLDSEITCLPPIGYSMSCLLEGFRHFSKREISSSQDMETIIRYICRVALGIPKFTCPSGDIMFALMMDVRGHVSAMESPKVDSSDMLLIIDECLWSLASYCDARSIRDLLPELKPSSRIRCVSEREESLLYGRLVQASPQELIDIFVRLSQGAVPLSRDLSHELIARLTQSHVPLSQMSSAPFPEVMDHIFPISLKLDICLFSKQGSSTHHRFLQVLQSLNDKTILSFVFNHAALELLFGFRSNRIASSQASFLVSVLSSVIESSDYAGDLIDKPVLLDLLESCFPPMEWIHSSSPVPRSLLSFIKSCVRKGPQATKDSFNPTVNKIESDVAKCLENGDVSLLKSTIRDSVFDIIGNWQLIVAAIQSLLSNTQGDGDKLLVDLLRKFVTHQDSLSASIFLSVFERYLESHSEELGGIILNIISRITGLQSSVWNSSAFVKTQLLRKEDNFEISLDLSAVIQGRHLQKLARRWNILNARIASVLITSISTYRQQFYSLCQEKITPEPSQTLLCAILEINIEASKDLFSSKGSWKKDSSSQAKALAKSLWHQNSSYIISRMQEALRGKEGQDFVKTRILILGCQVFSLPDDIMNVIEQNLSHTECNLTTCSILHSYLPALFVITDGNPNSMLKLLVICLRLLRGCIMSVRKVKQEGPDSVIERNFLNQLGPLLEDLTSIVSLLNSSSEFLDGLQYQDHFVKFFNICLKTHFTTPKLMDLLESIFSLSEHVKITIYSPKKLLELIFSHSKFEEVFDANKWPSASMEESKTSLTRLIFKAMASSPTSCCQLHYLQNLVEYYDGTLASSDRWILRIAHLYEEEAGISSLDSLVNHWSKKSDEGNVPSLLDASKVLHTINEFSASDNVESLISDSEQVYEPSRRDLYDMSFLFPFTIAILEQVSEKKAELISVFLTNQVGVAFMGLSSLCEETRRAAIHILSKVEFLVLSSEVKALSSMTLFIEAFRNALSHDSSSKVPRIPAVLASFAAQSLPILMKPESSMYPLIHRFLLQRPVIDLHDLPMFYEMIYASSETNRRERIWIVHLLSRGITIPQDLKLYKRRHAVDILMSFYDSPVSDPQLKKVIFQTIGKAVSNPSVAWDLIHDSGITSFLAYCSSDINPSSDDVSTIFTKMLGDVINCIPSHATSILSGATIIANAFLLRITDAILMIESKELTIRIRETFVKLIIVLTNKPVEMGGTDLINVLKAWERTGEPADLLISFLSSVRSLHLEDPYSISLAAKMISLGSLQTSVIHWLIAVRLNSFYTSYGTLSKTREKEWNEFMANLNYAFQLPKIIRSGSLAACCTLMTLMHRDLDLDSPLTSDQFSRILSPKAILSSGSSLPSVCELDEHIFCNLKASLFRAIP